MTGYKMRRKLKASCILDNPTGTCSTRKPWGAPVLSLGKEPWSRGKNRAGAARRRGLLAVRRGGKQTDRQGKAWG